MRQDRIYYLGFYDILAAKCQRNYVLAAIAKMDYIASVMVRSGLGIEIISASWIVSDKFIFDKGGRTKIGNNIYLTTLPSFGTKTKLGRNLKIVFSLFVLLTKLLAIKKSDILVVYHSPWLSVPVKIAKKIKGFKLLLEVEEIYADITSMGKVFDKMEFGLIDIAGGYLLSTDLLKKKISTHKPSVVIYGRYSIEPTLAQPIKDGKIRLLYAGIIDTKKAGAFNALNAAKYLSEKYELRIIGFGDIERLKREIDVHNNNNKCQVYYDGLLSGDDYIAYCQQCHIGLATQNMEGKYLESSFPSKILSFLSMGLNVVSGRIECVSVSEIGDLVTYYDTDTAEAIAQAIKCVKLSEYSFIKNRILALDNCFECNLVNILK